MGVFCAGCVITGFSGACGPAPTPPTQGAQTPQRRLKQNSPPPPPPAAPPALGACDADYEGFGDPDNVFRGFSPVAEVRRNSSLVLEQCRIQDNNIRQVGSAAISIRVEETDYDASDFPCAVGVRGGVVESSFAPGQASNKVSLPSFGFM